MNESQAKPNRIRGRSFVVATFCRILWFGLLFLLVASLALYAVASSFPIPGSSEPRSGPAAVHESIGVAMMQVIDGPFSWLYSFLDGKTAGLVVWLIWAYGLYLVSSLLRRPRWVFTPRAQL